MVLESDASQSQTERSVSSETPQMTPCLSLFCFDSVLATVRMGDGPGGALCQNITLLKMEVSNKIYYNQKVSSLKAFKY